MFMNKKTIGIILLITGAAILIYSFFYMYTLVGNCPNGASGCSSYSNWKITNIAGFAVILDGIILLILNRKRS